MLVAAVTGLLASCGSPGKVQANNPGAGAGSAEVSVGVTKVGKEDSGADADAVFRTGAVPGNRRVRERIRLRQANSTSIMEPASRRTK